MKECLQGEGWANLRLDLSEWIERERKLLEDPMRQLTELQRGQCQGIIFIARKLLEAQP